MKKTFLYFLFSLYLFLIGCYPSDATLQKGINLLEEGKGKEGVSYFQNLHSEYDLPITEYFLGYALFRNNESQKALPLLYDSLEKKSLKDRYIGDRSFAEFLAFNSQNAKSPLFSAGLKELEKYRNAKDVPHDDKEILMSLAYFYLKQQSYEQAITYFYELAEVAENNEEKISDLFLIAYIYEEKMQDFSRAEKVLDDILAIQVTDAAYRKKIRIYEKSIEHLMKKGELLLKYLRNLGEINEGKEDIYLATKEIEKILAKAGIIFVKLNKASDRFTMPGSRTNEKTRKLFLKKQIDALNEEYTVIANKT